MFELLKRNVTNHLRPAGQVASVFQQPACTPQFPQKLNI